MRRSRGVCGTLPSPTGLTGGGGGGGGGGDGCGAASPRQILSQNTVPSLFLAIAMLEFVLILLDRMIYASKSIRLKLLMQWTTVIGFHIWIFFVLPSTKQYACAFRGRSRPPPPTDRPTDRLTRAGAPAPDALRPATGWRLWTTASCRSGTCPSASTGTSARVRYAPSA